MSDEKEDAKKNFTIVANDIARCANISMASKALYLVIKSYNPSFPSYKILQEITGWGKTTISLCLKELVLRSLIKYEKGNSCKRANQYFITSLDQCDLTSPQWGPVMKKKRSPTSPQRGPVTPPTSPQPGPELVLNGDSNKNNIKKPNKNKKSKGETPAPRKLKLISSNGPIEELKDIGNDLCYESLLTVSQKVQRNWLDIYRDQGVGWIKSQLIEAAAYHACKDTKNYGMAFTNWLKISSKPPPWQKEDRKSKEEKVANEIFEFFHGERQ